MAAHDQTGENSELQCTQVATIDTDVHIRHGSALKVRRLRLLVTNKDVPEPLLGCPLLEAPVFDTPKILAAAADKYAWTVDAENLEVNTAKNGTGNVARVLKCEKNTDEAGCVGDEDDSKTYWCDLGPETDN